MSLKTGKRIHGFQWTRLAMTQEVIDRVHELAEQQHAQYLDDDGFPKLDVIPGGNMSLESDDESYAPSNESVADLYNDYTDSNNTTSKSDESYEPMEDESDDNWDSEDEEENNQESSMASESSDENSVESSVLGDTNEDASASDSQE